MTQIVDSLPTPPPVDLIAARQRALDSLVRLAGSYRDAVAYRTAVAGNADSVLDADIQQRRIYVQLGAVGGEVAEAQYDQYKPRVGDTVVLTRPRLFGPGGWLVLGWIRGAIQPCYSTAPLPDI